MKNSLMKLYVYNFFVNLQFIGGVILPFFTIWGGLTLTQTLLLQSWYSVCIVLFEIPTGAFADRFGRKKTLSVAIVVNAVAAVVYSSTPNFYVFMLGEFLWAVASALMSGTDEALLYDTLKSLKNTKQYKKIYSRYESFGLLGLVIGAPIGSFLAERFGLQAPMFYLIVPFSIAFLVTLALKEPIFKRKVKRDNFIGILKGGTKYFFKHRILKILAIDMITISVAGYLMLFFYQRMLGNVGLNIGFFGWVQSGLVISEILIMNNFKRIEKVLGSKKNLIFFSSFITGAMFVLGGLTNSLPIVLIVVFVGGGFGLSRSVLFSNYFNKHIPSDKRATVLSSISMMNRLTIAIVIPFVGMLADWSFPTALIAIGLAAIVFSFFSRVEEGMLAD